MSGLTAYWWAPSRDPRMLLSELRHNLPAWVSMARSGGGVRNFGDELSRYAVREATGEMPRWESIGHADVIAIGSIVDLYLDRGGRGVVWGAGLRGTHQAVRPDHRARFLAVRGELTRQELGLSAATPLGDPGLLARSFVPRSQVRRGVVAIPHFTVFQHGDGRRAIASLRSEGIRVIPPSAPVEVVCESIASAEYVLTSSLHGLVVADAVETPCALVRFASTREPDFKYADYASSLGEPVDWAAFDPRPLLRGATRDSAEARTQRISSQVDRLIQGLMVAARSIV